MSSRSIGRNSLKNPKWEAPQDEIKGWSLTYISTCIQVLVCLHTCWHTHVNRHKEPNIQQYRLTSILHMFRFSVILWQNPFQITYIVQSIINHQEKAYRRAELGGAHLESQLSESRGRWVSVSLKSAWSTQQLPEGFMKVLCERGTQACQILVLKENLGLKYSPLVRVIVEHAKGPGICL